MALFSRVLRQSTLPAMAVAYTQRQYYSTSCDAPVFERKASLIQNEEENSDKKVKVVSSSSSSAVSSDTISNDKRECGMNPEETGMYSNLFPRRQLFQPKIEYPLWDNDWDGRQPTFPSLSSPQQVEDSGSTYTKSGDDIKRETMRYIRKNGTTRHIILVRHGQYDETHAEDEKRILTSIGRKQAELTGKRLAEMIKGHDDKFGPCNVKVLRVSQLARARETADIIANQLPPNNTVQIADPDGNLNEGRPAHHIPGGKPSSSTIQKLDEQHPRIEQAFRNLFYRAPPPKLPSDKDNGETPIEETSITKGKEVNEGTRETSGKNKEEELPPKHEFEIIVCHANVIRYFLCRALQLPPEAWLRLCTFNCSLTYLTIRPTGTVSCRMLGDIGHLPYNLSTFSGHHGYNW